MWPILDHVITIVAVLIPIGIAWNTTRHENARMHRENQDRLIAIETRLEPLWDWYNSMRYNNFRGEKNGI